MKLERHTIQCIKNKFQSNKDIITKADKGNTIVITYQQDYRRKIEEKPLNFLALNCVNYNINCCI